MNSGSGFEQVSLIHTLGLHTLLSPHTSVSPKSLLHVTLQLLGLPKSWLFMGLGFAIDMRAHRAQRPNRVRCLQTGGSPPVALHPALRPEQLLSVTGRRTYA